MAMRQSFFVLILAFGICGQAARADKDDLKSGPQVGQTLPGPFYSVVAHSAEASLAGKKNDFVEWYGQEPVVMVFAREISKPLTHLVKTLDAEVAKTKAPKLRAVVVVLSDDEALQASLKDYGKKHALKHVDLAIMEPNGPERYKISKEADVTVVMYQKRKVEANHAFKKSELDQKRVTEIVADLPKITSDK
jgi:hypothetical protein